MHEKLTVHSPHSQLHAELCISIWN